MSIEPTKDNKGSPTPSLMADIIDEITRQEGDKKESSAEAATTSASHSVSASSDLLSALLSNPELIAKLPAILSAIKPIMEAIGKQATSVTKGEAVSASASTQNGNNPPDSTPVSVPLKKESDRRAALLCAMKPYLCRDRQNAIDYIIKLSHLGEILRSL